MTTLVLLPGLDGTGDLFAPFLAHVPLEWRVQVVRYPSTFGGGYQPYVEFVRSVLPREDGYLMVAESFSGPIAIQLASETPAGLNGLVLAVTFARSPHPGLRAVAELMGLFPFLRPPLSPLRRLLLGKDATGEQRALLAEATSGLDPRIIRRRLKAIADVNVTEHLARLRLPRLYLQATHDRLVPTWCGTEIVGADPSSELVRIEGPHALFLARPLECQAAIAQFVDRE